MKPSHVLPLVAVALSAPAVARTVTGEQLWLDLSASGSVSGRLQGMIQLQPRFRDERPHTVQLLARGGLGWAVGGGAVLWLAYTHTAFPVPGRRDVNEERLYQQASLPLGRALGGTWSGRTRLEQRWRSNAGGAGWRLRQQVRYAHRLSSAATAPSFVLSLEPMVELNDTAWGARAGFDQLRGFVGVGLPLGRSAGLEAGYLNQLANLRHGDTAINHAAVVAVAYRF